MQHVFIHCSRTTSTSSVGGEAHQHIKRQISEHEKKPIANANHNNNNKLIEEEKSEMGSVCK